MQFVSERGSQNEGEVHIFAKHDEHDDREGHHYYTPPSARLSCIVVMTLAVIMLRGHHASQKYETYAKGKIS